MKPRKIAIVAAVIGGGTPFIPASVLARQSEACGFRRALNRTVRRIGPLAALRSRFQQHLRNKG